MRVRLASDNANSFSFITQEGQKFILYCQDNFGCGQWTRAGDEVAINVDYCLQCAGILKEIRKEITHGKEGQKKEGRVIEAELASTGCGSSSPGRDPGPGCDSRPKDRVSSLETKVKVKGGEKSMSEKNRNDRLVVFRRKAWRFTQEATKTAALGLIQGFSLGMGLKIVNRNKGANLKVLSNNGQKSVSHLKVAAAS